MWFFWVFFFFGLWGFFCFVLLWFFGFLVFWSGFDSIVLQFVSLSDQIYVYICGGKGHFKTYDLKYQGRNGLGP